MKNFEDKIVKFMVKKTIDKDTRKSFEELEELAKQEEREEKKEKEKKGFWLWRLIKWIFRNLFGK